MTDSPGDPSQVPDRENSASTFLQTPGVRQGMSGAGLNHAAFISLVGLSIAIFWTPLTELFGFLIQWQPEHLPSSHCLVIPLLSGALIWVERNRIFATVQYEFRLGGLLLASGLTVGWLGRRVMGVIGIDGSLALAILGLVTFWIGGFAFSYGLQAFRQAKFLLFFLLLTIPFPSVIIDPPITFVQHGSADVASFIFDITRVPVFRQGLFFTLPGLTIEVARVCSGIHSTMAIFILSLLAGHLAPLANWKRVFLALIIFPIVCFTNGLRIAMITLLAVYVDPRFIESSLHRRGGVLFFLLGLGLLMICFHLLRKLQFPIRAGQENRK